ANPRLGGVSRRARAPHRGGAGAAPGDRNAGGVGAGAAAPAGRPTPAGDRRRHGLGMHRVRAGRRARRSRRGRRRRVARRRGGRAPAAPPAGGAAPQASGGGPGRAARVSAAAADPPAGPPAPRADPAVTTPPYLPSGLMPELPPEVRIHEPRLALDGGRDGLAVIRRLASAARRYVRPQGAFVVETAGREQAWGAAALLREAGWSGVAVRPDLAGIDRFVAGRA